MDIAIAREYAISAYDAAYLELALRKEIPLMSLDKLLCNSAKEAGIAIQQAPYDSK